MILGGFGWFRVLVTTIQINLSFVKNFTQWNPDVTILEYNDIPGITNMLCSGKSYSKMYYYDPDLAILDLTIFPI